MVKRKLQWKIVLFICIIAVCLVIPIGLLLNARIENYHYNQFISGIEKGFENYNPEENENADALSVYLDMSGLYAGLFNIYGDNRSFTIVDSFFNTVYSSDYNFLNGEEYAFLNDLYLSSNFIKASAGELGDDDTLITIGGVSFYDYAVKKAGVVFYFRYYKQDWQNMVSQFNNIIFTALFISLLIAFVFGFLISKAITNPIENITRRTKDIAEGNFGSTLDRRGNDEIGQLASSINDMSKSLKEMLDEIKNEKNKVDTILNNMTDGIIAFDRQGKMIHANPEAMTMLNRVRMEEDLNSFLREYGIDTTADEIMNNTVKANERKLSLKRAGMIMRLGFAVFSGENLPNEGCIVILRDITEQSKMDIMQREFVANVSHELKTPLTSIKSYTETLLSGKVQDLDTERKFLTVIESEVDRMALLVTDLLQLSAMDMKRIRLDFQKHNIIRLIDETLEKVEVAAQEKNHTIMKNVFYNGKAVFDFEKIQRVLINLLTNSIKYTDPGGEISIEVSKEDGAVVIKVADNGMGIPKKDLTRIFDRFYRVEKARSRKQGGTGLGLAIAKEIIEAHHGDIKIKSSDDEGTEVVIKFPINSQWRNDDE